MATTHADHLAADTAISGLTLCSTREDRGLGAVDTYLTIESLGKMAQREFLPPRRNPIFGMVFGRHVGRKVGSKLVHMVDPKEVHAVLTGSNDVQASPWPVDVILAGASNFLASGYLKADKSRNNCLFMLHQGVQGHACCIAPNFAIGVAICHLMAALDYIRLGRLPWEDMLNEAQRAEHPLSGEFGLPTTA